MNVREKVYERGEFDHERDWYPLGGNAGIGGVIAGVTLNSLNIEH